MKKKITIIKPNNIVRKKRNTKKIEPKKSWIDKLSLWVYSKLNFIFGK